jgi:hypothetical protein
MGVLDGDAGVRRGVDGRASLCSELWLSRVAVLNKSAVQRLPTRGPLMPWPGMQSWPEATN